APERRLRLRLATRKRRVDLLVGHDDTGAATAAAGQCLDDHSAAIERGKESSRLVQRHRMIEAADDGHAGLLRGIPRPCLVAEQVEMSYVRTDEEQPGIATGFGEIAAFGKEAVARVDGIASCRLCR